MPVSQLLILFQNKILLKSLPRAPIHSAAARPWSAWVCELSRDQPALRESKARIAGPLKITHAVSGLSMSLTPLYQGPVVVNPDTVRS